MKHTQLLLWTAITGWLLLACSQPKPVKFGTSSVERVMAAMTTEEKVQLIENGQAIPRLGIPSTNFISSPRLEEYDWLPALLSLTWNEQLIENIGKAVGQEISQYGSGVVHTPHANILRYPVPGSQFGYYSEDPVVSGKIAAALVRGIQQNSLGASVSYLSPSEYALDQQQITLTPRALHEIHIKGIGIAIKESAPWVVMASNSKVNGVNTSQSSGLLRTILRNEWNFKDVVMSYGNDPAQIKAGNDLLLPKGDNLYDNILAALDSGTLKMTDINRSALHILTMLNRLTPANSSIPLGQFDQTAIEEAKQQIATEGVVLLKNDNRTLPLQVDTNRIATFDAAQSPAGVSKKVKQTDVALITIREEREPYINYYIPRPYTLTNQELRTIREVCRTYHAANKKVVVILDIDAGLETASWKHLPDAILLTCTTWIYDDSAVTDVISGKVNPSGRLPFTFPVSYQDLPLSAEDPSDTELVFNEDIFVGYRYFDTFRKPVSFPFGHGLSYTTFEYNNAGVKPVKDGFEVTVTITNTGEYAGKEVVQLYVSAPINPDLPKPVKELKAFAKTRLLAPHASDTITLRVNQLDLASFDDTASAWVAERGVYKFLIGASSQDIKQMILVDITKTIEKKVPPVLLPRGPINVMMP